MKSTNSGVNWIDHSSGFRNTLFALDFLDTENAISCGTQGSAAYTTNSGSSWHRVQAASDNDYLYQVDFVSSNTAYCVGEYGKIVKSDNGGINWSNLNSPVTLGLYSLHFFNDNAGWICGDSGKLLKTTNGGSSFSILPSGSNSAINDIFFIDVNTGWYASSNRRIYKTTDGGDNWYVPHTGIFTGGVGAVQFVNPNRGLAFTFDNKILVTSNGGTDWDQTSFPPNTYLNNIFAVDEQNFWTCGDYGIIYHTTNGGLDWNPEDNNNFVGRIFAGYFTDLNNGWFVGGNGLIVKYTNPISSISSNSNAGNVSGYTLFQNYPNPFNPATVINYQLTMQNYVSLKVYNALGIEVAVLVNEKQTPGNYEVDFDGSNLASGIYFYKLEVNNFSDTKRMVLVK